MPENIKLNIIYYLIFPIPVIVYLIFNRILSKSFKKLPDDPSYTEKKESGTIVRILKRLGTTVLVIALAFGIASIQRGALSEGFENADERRQSIIAEYEELNEDNIDPENGKTILTQSFLRKEYKLYVSGEQGGADFSSTMYKIIFISLLFTAGGVECIVYAFCFFTIKKKINILSIVASILLIPTIIVGFKIIDDNFGTIRLPDPENAKVSAVEVTINSRHENVHRSEDSSDSYTYHIVIDYGDGNGPVSIEVPYSMYDTAENPGTYLMGQAEEDGKKVDFELYSMYEYEAAGKEVTCEGRDKDENDAIIQEYIDEWREDLLKN